MTVAVVTGGASGFGAALAAECAGRGMDVALLDRDEEGARAVAERLAATGVRAIARRTDVSDAASVDLAAATVEAALGGADLVFSNVGVQLFGALEAMTDDDLVAMMASNPNMAAALVRAEDAASGVVDAGVAGAPYVITHGDVRSAVDQRASRLRSAAHTAVVEDP